LGILTIAVAAAIIGYLGAALAWRFWALSRWRGRRRPIA
jgi:hypothetical protein